MYNTLTPVIICSKTAGIIIALSILGMTGLLTVIVGFGNITAMICGGIFLGVAVLWYLARCIAIKNLKFMSRKKVIVKRCC